MGFLGLVGTTIAVCTIVSTAVSAVGVVATTVAVVATVTAAVTDVAVAAEKNKERKDC